MKIIRLCKGIPPHNYVAVVGLMNIGIIKTIDLSPGQIVIITPFDVKIHGDKINLSTLSGDNVCTFMNKRFRYLYKNEERLCGVSMLTNL